MAADNFSGAFSGDASYSIKIRAIVEGLGTVGSLGGAIQNAAEQTKISSAIFQLWGEEVKLAQSLGMGFGEALTHVAKNVQIGSTVLKDLTENIRENVKQQVAATLAAEDAARRQVNANLEIAAAARATANAQTVASTQSVAAIQAVTAAQTAALAQAAAARALGAGTITQGAAAALLGSIAQTSSAVSAGISARNFARGFTGGGGTGAAWTGVGFGLGGSGTIAGTFGTPPPIPPVPPTPPIPPIPPDEGGFNTAVFGRIGGRLGGMASAVPGGGYVGSQLAGGLGLSGGAAIGLGAVGVGAFATYEIVKHVAELAKWAQQQKLLADELGITVQKQEVFGRITERTGVNVDNAAKSVAGFRDKLVEGGSKAREIEAAFEQLGLKTSTAFKDPASALDDIVHALGRVVDPAERARRAFELGGEELRKLAAIAPEWDKLFDRSSKNLITDKQLKELQDAHQSIKDLGEGWDILWAKFARPLTISIKFLTSGDERISDALKTGNLGGLSLGAMSAYRAPTHGASDSWGPTPAEIKAAEDKKAADADELRKSAERTREQFGSFSDRTRAHLERITRQEDELKRQETDIPASEYRRRYAALESERNAAQEAERKYAAYQSELRSLREKPPQIDSQSGQTIGRELSGISQRFPIISEEATRREQQGLAPTQGGRELLGRVNQLVGPAFSFDALKLSQDVAKERRRLDTQSIEEQRREEEAARKAQHDAIEETKRRLEGEARIEQTNIAGRERIQQAGAGTTQAIEQARIQNIRATGLVSPQGIAGLEYQSQSDTLSQTYQARSQGLIAQRGVQQRLLQGLPIAEETVTERARAQSEIDKLNLELSKELIDKRTKEIELINKFNDAVDKTAESMRNQFVSGFSSIILGAQQGGGKGVTQAARGFLESQEKQVIDNVGKNLYENVLKNVIPHAGSDKGFGALLQGTLFGATGQHKDLPTAIDKNVLALDENTRALVAFKTGGSPYAASAGTVAYTTAGGTGSTLDTSSLPLLSGANQPGQLVNNLDLSSLTGTVSSITSAASAATSATSSIQNAIKSGNPSAIISSVKNIGSILGRLSNLGGGSAPSVSSSDLSDLGIFSPAGQTSSTGSGETASEGSVGSGDFGGGGQSGEAPSSTTSGNFFGSTAGRIGGGLLGAAGTAQGIYTATKGGAKNVLTGGGEAAAGIGAIVAALAPALAIAGPIGAAVGGLTALIGAFIPSGTQKRQEQEEKTLFTQQYLAPVSQNITAGGNAGFADSDIYGNVRSSNFSPYNVIANAYEDVPRRTVVPGRETSTFGGVGDNTPGAIYTPQPPGQVAPQPIHITYNASVQTLDAASFNDNGDRIMDAMHVAMNRNPHPLIEALQGKMGLR